MASTGLLDPGAVFVLEDRNRQVYRDVRVAQDYAGEAQLQAPEKAVLAHIGASLRGQPIMDIGVGGGRTTAHLIALSSDYVGIDYSPAMVEIARSRYTRARIELGDARDLSSFTDGYFGLVLFSFNGLDYIAHKERLITLAGMWRKVRPGGWLVFSTHNRDAFGIHLERARDPLRQAVAIVRFGLEHVRRQLNRRHEVQTDEYAILNDGAHDNRLMTYYISLDSQRRQLLRAGVDGALRVYDGDGYETVADTHSPWLTYAIQKT